jgi:ABC-2 type transport system permease protein
MALGAVRALVRKDLLLFFNDRRAMIMSFVAPILIASFFGFFFSGRPQQAGRVPVRVVDLDGSAISKTLLAGLSRDASLEVEGATAEEAREAVRRGTARVAVVVPRGFGEATSHAFFGGAEKPRLQLLHDPSRALELAMARGILTQHVMDALSAGRFAGEPGRVPRVPFTTIDEAVTARSGVAYNGFAHAFAGMGVQFLLFACIDLAVVMLLERQLGLWKRLRAAPLSRFVLLAAKATSGALISLMTLGGTFSFGMIVFGIRIQGSVVGFVAVCLSTALMASCFGILIAALGKTPPATRGVATLAVLLMVMLGGAWVPSFVFPPWVQQVTLVVPARWAVDGLDATTWRGVGLLEILPTVGVLLGFAALFGALAVARFRWEVD